MFNQKSTSELQNDNLYVVSIDIFLNQTCSYKGKVSIPALLKSAKYTFLSITDVI